MGLKDKITQKFQDKIALSADNWDKYAKKFQSVYNGSKLLSVPVLRNVLKKMGNLSDMDKHFTQGYLTPVSLDVNFKRDSQNVVLPVTLVEKMIRKSSHRILMKGCLCRTSQKCEHYPQDFGCIFIGEATPKISKRGVAKDASVEEALAHLKKGAEMGLVCMCVWVEFEGFGLGLSKDEHHKFLEICFCCPCCCVALNSFKYFGRDVMQRFKTIGWKPQSGKTCERCGTCASVCPMKAVTVNSDGVTVSSDCIGCGICASKCPNKAIQMTQIAPIKENIEDYFFGFRPDIG